jgi:uncharacterized protein
MSGGLPANVDPIRLADQGTRLSGTIPLKRMKRLLTYCRSEEGEARVDLEFNRDPERNLRTVQGTVEAEIVTTCERCLEPMTLSLEANVNLLLASREPGTVEEPEDVLVVENEPIALSELVENELILAMPMIPMHQADQCPAAGLIGDSGPEGNNRPESDKKSPFAELAKLKRSNR